MNQLNTQRKLPQQARAKATVEAILQATIQVLIDDGYAGMTTTRVAERAGVSVGTLYQYFPDKESLVRTLTADHEAAMLGELAGAAAQTAGQPLAPRVHALLAALLRAKAADGLLGPALAMTMLNLDGRTALARALDQSRQLLIPLLREHAHEIPHLDPAQAANTLVHAVDGVVMSLVTGNTPLAIDDPVHLEELERLALGYLGLGMDV